MNCVDGEGWKMSHAAEGWLVSPEGRRIQPVCADHARGIIDEYREKLGESWTFKPETEEAAA